jgi:TonB family protein
MDVRRPRRNAVPAWLAVSIIVHGALALAAVEIHIAEFAGTDASAVDPRAAELAANAVPIDISMIDLPATTAEREKQQAELEAKAIEEKQEEEKKDEEKTQRGDTVVDVPQPLNEQRPTETSHRAEFDTTVEKETVHMGKPVLSGVGKTGKDPLAKADGPAQKQPQAEQPARGGKPGAPEKPVAIGSSESAVGGGRAASETGEKGAADGFEAESGGTQAKRGKGLGVSIDPMGGPKVPGGGDGGDGKPKADLRPSGDALAKAGVGTYDKLDDIDEGDDTLLNTKRFKYASFFNRVKRAVWENWHADRVYSIRDPDGRIYGIKDRLTVLKVSLRADGSLANVIIEKPCGVDFLDDEAVSAFKKAQPFPNPPKGLVDEESKLITFRFGFTLEIQDRPSWKIVKYQ